MSGKKKYEYKTLNFEYQGRFSDEYSEEDIEIKLNEFGEDGWLVVSQHGKRYTLCREIPSE